MSGGGGGVIIRNRLRAAAETSSVQDHVHPAKKPKLLEILAKSDGDWSDDETHYVNRRIMEAYDEQC